VIFTVKFWKDAAERAVATAAQAALGLVGADGVFNLHIGWLAAGMAVGGAALLSVLKSIVASRFGGDPESASLVDLGNKPAE